MSKAVVYTSLEEVRLPPGRPVVLTVGTFDGVHRAHQALLAEARTKAQHAGAMVGALTFRNHPRSVIKGGVAPSLLTTWERKRELILEQGVDFLCGLWFDEQFSLMSAEDFVRLVVVERLGARAVVSGPLFRFGNGGAGNPAMLEAMSSDLGYAYRLIEPVTVDGIKVSSTRIREALASGDVALAARLLGRPHRIASDVVTGDRLGRTISFPTANLRIDTSVASPADGVYAVEVQTHDGWRGPGMMNIGVRPTVNGRERRHEVHLIGFSGELEGTTLSVDFVARLREERRFAGLEELKAQLQVDRNAALAAVQG